MSWIENRSTKLLRPINVVAVVSSDPLGHQSSISYADSFADGNNSRNTFAYPTTVTDADGYTATAKYAFDAGQLTWRQTPQPNTTSNQPGPIQTFAYDAAGRLTLVTNLTNGSHTEHFYEQDLMGVDSFTTILDSSLGNPSLRAYRGKSFDGQGRVMATFGSHPGSVGGYTAQVVGYDVKGRVVLQSNPTEINGAWVATGDDAAGWLYTTQTYDWNGRPLVTTNTDGTTKEASYSGCGCAGGEVVTLTDEGTMDGGSFKRRQQKVYSDVLGRTVKTELLNWQGGSVYATTVNTYNARNQITQVTQHAGSAGSGAAQDTTMSYDGYGRLKTKHVPQQDSGTATVWDYNANDTIQKVTDARGASATYTYNNRHLVTSINYSAPSGITPTPNVSFAYDAAGNRTSMTDGVGSRSYNYDQLSRMSSETRNFAGFGNFAVNYQYNLAGELSSITDPANATIDYTRDSSGRLTGISGTPFGGVTTYASNVQYRAWDAIKHLNYGDASTLEASFNSRLQVSAFAISGKLSKTYDYYADGRLRFSSDLLDHRFDRFYSFDHVGRLKEAFSGAEARGEAATTDRPYKQTQLEFWVDSGTSYGVECGSFVVVSHVHARLLIPQSLA